MLSRSVSERSAEVSSATCSPSACPCPRKKVTALAMFGMVLAASSRSTVALAR
ncbi:hypothetical protein STIAU_8233, partial [Stigmatella aurantiaca DW4/3-1]